MKKLNCVLLGLGLSLSVINVGATEQNLDEKTYSCFSSSCSRNVIYDMAAADGFPRNRVYVTCSIHGWFTMCRGIAS